MICFNALVIAALLLCLVLGSAVHVLGMSKENSARLTETAVVAQNYSLGCLWTQEVNGSQCGPYAGLMVKLKANRGTGARLGVPEGWSS